MSGSSECLSTHDFGFGLWVRREGGISPLSVLLVDFISLKTLSGSFHTLTVDLLCTRHHARLSMRTQERLGQKWSLFCGAHGLVWEEEPATPDGYWL